ncbi:hypothetical protein BD779DRAFT_1474961 [Infundibulicybe gibba]|nr:hypothetical protein BD779DRAFT_1474961 [Infundibulicybe gibba]
MPPPRLESEVMLQAEVRQPGGSACAGTHLQLMFEAGWESSSSSALSTPYGVLAGGGERVLLLRRRWPEGKPSGSGSLALRLCEGVSGETGEGPRWRKVAQMRGGVSGKGDGPEGARCNLHQVACDETASGSDKCVLNIERSNAHRPGEDNGASPLGPVNTIPTYWGAFSLANDGASTSQYSQYSGALVLPPPATHPARSSTPSPPATSHRLPLPPIRPHLPHQHFPAHYPPERPM